MPRMVPVSPAAMQLVVEGQLTAASERAVPVPWTVQVPPASALLMTAPALPVATQLLVLAQLTASSSSPTGRFVVQLLPSLAVVRTRPSCPTATQTLDD